LVLNESWDGHDMIGSMEKMSIWLSLGITIVIVVLVVAFAGLN